MDPVAGGLGALLMLVLNQVFNQSHFINSHLFLQWTYKLVAAGAPVAGLPLWQAVLAFHVAAWIAQFIGHGVFEGRAPALLDSWDQVTCSSDLKLQPKCHLICPRIKNRPSSPLPSLFSWRYN